MVKVPSFSTTSQTTSKNDETSRSGIKEARSHIYMFGVQVPRNEKEARELDVKYVDLSYQSVGTSQNVKKLTHLRSARHSNVTLPDTRIHLDIAKSRSSLSMLLNMTSVTKHALLQVAT